MEATDFVDLHLVEQCVGREGIGIVDWRHDIADGLVGKSAITLDQY